MPRQRMCTFDGCDVKNPPVIHKRLFKFPKDPVYRGEWLQKCSKSFQKAVSETTKSLDSGAFGICSQHFTATDYKNPLTATMLRPTAIPRDKIVVQSLAKFHDPAAWYEKISYKMDVPTNDIKIEEEPLIPESPTFGNSDGISFKESPSFGNDDLIPFIESPIFGNDDGIPFTESPSFGNDDEIPFTESPSFGNDDGIPFTESDDRISVPESSSVLNGHNLKIVNVFPQSLTPLLFALPPVQTPQQSAHKSINTHVSSCDTNLEDSGASNIQCSCVGKKDTVGGKYLRRDMIIKKKRITFKDIIRRVVDSEKISPFLCMLLSHELPTSKQPHFNQELLDMCQRLFNSSRKTYLILRELIPSLPSTATMKRMNRKMSKESQNTDGIQVNDTDVG